MTIIALAALGLAAIAAAAIILASGSGAGSGSQDDTAYRWELQSALSPLIGANQSLSSALTALDASRPTMHAAQNAAAAAEAATLSTRGGISVLAPPSSEQTFSQQVQQALADESGYPGGLRHLSTPTGPTTAQLQTLATAAQTSLVPVNSLISGASGSVSGTNNLISWADGAAGAANQTAWRNLRKRRARPDSCGPAQRRQPSVHHQADEEVSTEEAQAAAEAMNDLFELFQDDDVLDMFEMEEPAGAALAGHDLINQQLAVVDQRVESWFRPFGWTPPDGLSRRSRRRRRRRRRTTKLRQHLPTTPRPPSSKVKPPGPIASSSSLGARGFKLLRDAGLEARRSDA